MAVKYCSVKMDTETLPWNVNMITGILDLTVWFKLIHFTLSNLLLVVSLFSVIKGVESEIIHFSDLQYMLFEGEVTG